MERNNPKSSETIITIPVFRDFLKQSIISAVTAHTMPPLPKNENAEESTAEQIPLDEETAAETSGSVTA